MNPASSARNYKGFLIDVSRDNRDRWRVRLRKADGTKILSVGHPVESDMWVSPPYSDRAAAMEQVKALIDVGSVS